MDLKTCLKAHKVLVASDSPYQSRARLLQALWRESRGLAEGKHRGNPLGSRLEMPMAERSLANFLTEAAKTAVRAEVASAARTQKLYGRPRLYDDLLSSQPLCFNLFSDLRQNLELASRVFQRLHPLVHHVTAIEFEHSPARGDSRYTGDRSAFDVFVEYEADGGALGFLGIEVKYHESLKGKVSPHRTRYDELAAAMRVFKSPRDARLQRAPLQQVWRDHLLMGSLLLAQGAPYRHGAFVFLYPLANTHCRDAVAAYRECLERGDHEPSFIEWHLESVVAALQDEHAGDWVTAFHARYLDFEAIARAAAGP